MMRATACTLLMGLMLLAGCETAGGVASTRAARGSGLIDPLDARALGYTNQWPSALQMSRGQRIHAADVLDDLLIVVERPENMVSAIAVRDGSLRWRKMVGIPSEVLYHPVRTADRIYVNSDSRLFVLDANNGRLLEIQNLEFPVRSGPVITGFFAIFGGIDGTIYAHDVESGFSKWQYRLTEAIATTPIESNGLVFAADMSGVYAMIEANTGRLAWRNRTFGAVVAQPASNAQSVFIPSRDQSLYALARTTGRDRWIFRSPRPLVDAPAAVDNLLFQPVPGEGLVTLDANTGEQLWITRNQAKPVQVRNNQVIMHDGRSLITLEVNSGELIKQVRTAPLQMVLRGPEDSLILITPEARMLRLNPLN